MGLSDAQELAVMSRGKNICVSAAAGSGKTLVLVERFLHLVMREKLSPASILAITFTDRAANEMKQRIIKRLTQENLEEARREVENAAIGTIHSFCARLLREHPVEAGVDPHFSILESTEAELLQERVLDEVIESSAAEAEVFQFLKTYEEIKVRKGILSAYRRSRNFEVSFEEALRRRVPADPDFFKTELQQQTGQAPPDMDSLLALKAQLRAGGPERERIRQTKQLIEDYVSFLLEEETLSDREIFIQLALRFEKVYEEAKRRERALDFDDLQIRAVRLLGSDQAVSKAVRKIYQERFAEILVDEFQDTNRLQERLLDLIRRPSNLFIVGDLKQSIYGFRGTELKVFIEKEKAFNQDGMRISLVENYRSRPRLINFINQFFEILWREDGLSFEKLRAVREEENSGPRVERLRLEPLEGESADELRIREARRLAHRLRLLAEEEGVAYKNIACLFEAMSDVHFYEQELRRLDIPYFVVSNRGFYSQTEIRDLMSFLSVLENPSKDVPLAAVLRSPLFQVSDDTLFWLADCAKVKNRRPLMEAVQQFGSIAQIAPAEKEKLAFFKETFEKFLQEKEKLHLSELVEKILRVTGYDLYVLRMRHSERRSANLRKLMELAREMESRESLHLGDFVRAIQGLELREVREAEAQVEAEGEGVKLMSIHAAKGLEFDVVVLPDLGRSGLAEGGGFLLSEEGFGLRDTLTYRWGKARMERLRSEESKRLLYVGMTRAREKLILSGSASRKPQADSFHEMPTWAHWVDQILSEGKWDVAMRPEEPAKPFAFERRKSLAERKPFRKRLESLAAMPIRESSTAVDEILKNLQEPEKTYFERIDLPVSAFFLFVKNPEDYFRVYEIGATSSFEVKEEEMKKEEGEFTSAAFGTRVHLILEQVFLRRLNLKETKLLIHQFTLDLSEERREEMSHLVCQFLGTEQAKEILKAGKIYPELSFVLRLPCGLVHGKIDLIYQNLRGEWFVLDYKTSFVDKDSFGDRGEDYRTQMELYALGLWQILGESPREGRIYFLRPNLVYPISFSANGLDDLFERYSKLQKKILEFRKAKLKVS